MQAIALKRVFQRAGRAATLGGAAAVALLVAACATNLPQLPASPPETTGSLQQGAAAKDTVRAPRAKVAILLPLSAQGQLGSIARAMKQAGEMVLFDANAPQFELHVKDDLGTPEGAKAAAEQAVAEGADIILGPLLSASVEAAAPVASAARIPIVAFSNDRRLSRPGVYLLSFLPEQDVERIVSYALAQNRRNFAALVPDDAYGEIVTETLKRTVGAAQANIVAIERYGRGGSGMLEATRRLGEAMTGTGGDGSSVPDALLMPGEQETLTSIGPLIAYARIDTTRVKLLGTAGWEAPSLGRDPTFVGGWFPAPDQRGWQTFSERFTKSFGSAPPRLASLAYDGVSVALALARTPERFAPASFTRASGFQGADGTLRFETNGTVVRPLGVYEVQAFGSRVLEPAPSGTAAMPAAAGRPAGRATTDAPRPVSPVN